MPLPELSLSTLSRTVDHWLLRPPVRASDGPDDRELFVLDAPYQRGSVWTVDQRRALIKSILMGLPVGSVTVPSCPTSRAGGSYRVIDGKQRVEAIRAFVAGEFGIPREWLADRAVSERCQEDDPITWAQLSDYGRRKLENSSLPALEFDSALRWIHDPQHPKAIARNNEWYAVRRSEEQMLAAEAELYGLLNGGGTPQTEADMANAAELAKGSVG